MKKIFFLATAFVFSLGAFAQTKVDETVKMNTEKHDFGNKELKCKSIQTLITLK